ncbi:unnamed protein product [Schistosoma turkestanicum]|nr:unnamed protein product [Schistosoma turkestanicum]
MIMALRESLVLFFLSSAWGLSEAPESYEVYFEPSSIILQQNEYETLYIGLNDTASRWTDLEVEYWDKNRNLFPTNELGHFAIRPIDTIKVELNQWSPNDIIVIPKSIGFISLGIKSNKDITIVNTEKPLCHITVVRQRSLYTLQMVMGWLYFAAWTISFYPQLIMNCKRRSVVGFNFDFAVFNVVGYFFYNIYNIGLYWIPLIQKQYLTRNRLGSIPVMINDLAFSIHAFTISLLTIFQIFVYKRGGQRVSKICVGILVSLFIYSVIFCILSGIEIVQWLDTLYMLSYINLFTSLIKYAPQAFMNFRRKSTEGWSIDYVMLDFAAGVFSISQLLISAYNNDDFSSITGSPEKLVLGILSMAFNILFMIQHWIFYQSSSSSSSKSLSQLQSQT